MKKLMITAAICVLSAMTMAQTPPPDNQGGPPQGPPPMGGMMMRGPRGGGNPVMLAMRPDVQADLGLTDEQKAKLSELAKTMRPAGMRGFGGPGRGGPGGFGGGQGGPGGGGPGGPPGDDAGGPPPPPVGGDGGGQGGPPPADDGQGGPPPDRTQGMPAGPRRFGGPGGPGGPGRPGGPEMAKKAWKGLKEILTGDQVERLKGIEIQIVGNRAVTDPEIGRSLGVTEAQQTKIRSLLDQQREANRSVMEKVQNGEIDPSEIRTAMDRNNKELNKQIGSVLTSDQRSHMESMKGKPFQQEDQNPGG